MGIVPTTWNASDKDASITLSNGNLTAACSSGGSGGVRSVDSVASGKYYWELTVQTSNAREIIGAANSGWTLSTILGNSSGSYGYFAFDGNKRNNSSSVAYGATFGNTNIISVLLDMDAGTITFWKNGVSQGQAYSGITGAMFAAFSGGSGSVSEQVTANFGATAFTYTPPGGYQAGFGKIITGVGSAAGSGVATGVGAATFAGVGSAAGTSTPAAVGAKILSGVGSASGVGAAAGVGDFLSIQSGVGAAAGSGAATGVGAATFSGVGASTGTGAASGVGRSTAEGGGSATGTASIDGRAVSPAVASPAVASAAGQGTADGVSNFTVVISAIGTAQGIAQVLGIGREVGERIVVRRVSIGGGSNMRANTTAGVSLRTRVGGSRIRAY